MQMGMGKTIQAISVLVTHRDDEMAFVFDGSEEAKVAATAKAVKDAAAAAAAAERPRISLGRAQQSGGNKGGQPRASVRQDDSVSKDKALPTPSNIAASEPPVQASSSVFAAYAVGKDAGPLLKAVKAKRGSSSGKNKSTAKSGSSAVEEKGKGGTVCKDEPSVPSASIGAVSAPAPAPIAVIPCPHVKPGKKVAPGTMCQECLRDQAPQAQVQVGEDVIVLYTWWCAFKGPLHLMRCPSGLNQHQ